MDNDERTQMICKLAEQLQHDDTHDSAIEAVIKALLKDDEYVQVSTRYPDHTATDYINKYERRYQTCVYRKELYSSERTEVSAADRIDID